MEKRLFDIAVDLEEVHWWSVSRRKIIETVINNYIKDLGKNACALDIGSGTGINFNILSKYTQNISGMEYDPYAIELSNKNNNFNVLQGSLPDNIPFPDEKFDLVTLFDVLEHIDDDINSLKNILAKVKPGGYFLMTVPAYQFLWSKHDETVEHKRRYTLNELLNKMENFNISIKYKSYFNTYLLPLIVAIRFFRSKVSSLKNQDDVFLPSKPINFLLRLIMSSERFIIKRGSLPFGVSIIVLAQKTTNI